MSIHLKSIALLLALVVAGPAWAADETTRDGTPADACRVEVIPARVECVERTIPVAAVTRCQRVPVYEEVTLPTYERRCEPRYREIEVPVYATREVPTYRTERVPVWGERCVPVYRTETKEVSIPLFNPFCCKTEELKLWDTCERVQCGTKMVPAITGHTTRRVPCGTRTERYIADYTTKRIRDGQTVRVVKTGERTVRRCTGYRTERIVVRPATTRIVRETIQVPCERVTVVADDSDRSEPLLGTTKVMTESEFLRIADAR